MYRVFLALWLIGATACSNNNNTADDETSAVPAPSESVVTSLEEEDSVLKAHEDIAWDEIEGIQLSRVMINNKVPLHTSLSRFKAAFGEADSLVTPDWTYICDAQFEEEFEYFYKNGSRFELYKDSLACDEFRLTPAQTVSYEGITFSHNTTWADMKKRFPKAVRQAENEGYTDMITLRDADVKESDSSVRFFFENGILVRIVYFIPC
ncbi:hypothetical protein [Chitinophaga sp. HK235]|uniref:hypothetical protein n=1 Tax=Chitinophaga sp. HK235 TaxID=2952571 RepID=UPI001BAA63D4|nr:hypothetical protein [Chitinophaga sp. HK235]